MEVEIVEDQLEIPVFATSFGITAESRRWALEEGGLGDLKEKELEIVLLDMKQNGLVEIGREMVEKDHNMLGVVFSVKEEEITKLQEKARKYIQKEWDKQFPEAA